MGSIACSADFRPYHPLSPLTPREITAGASILRSIYPASIDLQFKAITLHEPEKGQYLAWNNGEGPGPRPPRRAYIPYYIRGAEKFFESIVNLDSKEVESNIRQGSNVHGPADAAEISLVEKLCLEDKWVKAEIEKLKLPENMMVTCDPWTYGLSPPRMQWSVNSLTDCINRN